MKTEPPEDKDLTRHCLDLNADPKTKAFLKIGGKNPKTQTRKRRPQKFGVTPENADPKTKIDLSLI